MPSGPLPRFSSAENEDLTKFLTQFEAVINKYKFSDYEKLILLKQQVSGRALVLLNSLEAHNLGYIKAKELLEKALAFPEIQMFNTMRQLTELNLDLCDDPFEYVSKVKNIVENVKKLNISSDQFLQYFVWRGLNDRFKNLLINITNKTWPSIIEISDNFFTACERYVHQKKKKESKQSTDMAVNVASKSSGKENSATKFFPCSLCSSDGNMASHNIRDCKKFPSSAAKVDQLKRINGCIRCGFASHATKNCKYRFRDRCSKCGEFHWLYLCPDSEESRSPAKKKPVFHW